MVLAPTSPVVLITRPETDGAAFSALAAKAGFTPVASPVLEIDFMAPEDVDTAPITAAGALAFTSANGVRAYGRLLGGSDKPVFAVGAVTAEAARSAGFHRITTAGGDVESLAAHIVEKRHEFSGPVVHVAGSERRGDLVALLAQHEINATRCVLYRASPISVLNKEAQLVLQSGASSSGFYAVAFFSPRSAVLFMRLVEKANLKHRLCAFAAVCLSDAVAHELESADWRSINVARRRDSDGVIDALKEIFSSQSG